MKTIANNSKRLMLIACGFAVLAAGPAASVASAADNSDNTGAVAEGHTRADKSQCTNYKQWYDDSGTIKDDKTRETNQAADKKLASDRGCKWAQRVKPKATGPKAATPKSQSNDGRRPVKQGAPSTAPAHRAS